MFTRSSTRGVAAVLVVASVALAACGSDDSSSESVDTQAATTDVVTTEPSTTEPTSTEPTATEPVDTTDAEGAGGGAVWRGIEPNTTPMSPEDSAAIDALFQEILDTAGDQVPGMWIGIWTRKPASTAPRTARRCSTAPTRPSTITAASAA